MQDLSVDSKFYTPMGIAFSYCSSEDLGNGLHYCEQKQLWWKGGRVFDKRSANHNGIIGVGAHLKQIVKENK